MMPLASSFLQRFRESRPFFTRLAKYNTIAVILLFIDTAVDCGRENCTILCQERKHNVVFVESVLMCSLGRQGPLACFRLLFRLSKELILLVTLCEDDILPFFLEFFDLHTLNPVKCSARGPRQLCDCI
jgi:hypothetical protein